MKKVKVVISKVFNLFIYFILLLLIFVFAINLFSKDVSVSAQEINPLPITEIDYAQVGTISFVLQPTSSTVEMYFIVPKGVGSLEYQAYNSDLNFYQSESFIISEGQGDYVLQSNQFAYDIYESWFGSTEASIFLNYFDMYRYYGGILMMPFHSSWPSIDGPFSQSFTFNGSTSTMVFIDNEVHVMTDNLPDIFSFIDVFTQGYNKGYLTSNEDLEVNFNYAYSQGVQHASNIYQREIDQINSEHQLELALLEDEVLTAKQQGFDEGVAYGYEMQEQEQTILTFVGSILGSVLSFIWLIITAPTIFGINLLTIILLLLTLFVVLTILKIIF